MNKTQDQSGYENLLDVSLTGSDVSLFPAYRSLVACLRDGSLPDGDIDLTYFSKQSDPDGVSSEFITLCKNLIDAGYQGSLLPHGFLIKSPVRANIYPSWVSDGRYDISFGYHGAPAVLDAAEATLRKSSLGGQSINLPDAAEKIVTQLYGDNWRAADEAVAGERTVDTRYHVSDQKLRPVFWKQYYKYNEVGGGSTFAEFVSGQVKGDSLIVDLGCGSCRDTVFFAQHHHQAIGADAAAEGLQQGISKNLPNCRFMVVDAASSSDLDTLFQAREIKEAAKLNHEIVVYTRFFMHAISDEVEATILSAVHRNLPTVTFVAEFRTDKDAERPKFNAPHYRRFVKSEDFCDRLRQLGFRIDYFHEGTGLSVYKGEDPFLCRVIARLG